MLAIVYKLGISNISHTNCQPSKRGFYHMIQCSHMQKRKITSWLDYRSLCFSSCYSKILDLNKRACAFCFLLFWFWFWVPWSPLLCKFSSEMKILCLISQSIAMEMKGVPEILAFCICWLIQKGEKVRKKHLWWSRGKRRLSELLYWGDYFICLKTSLCLNCTNMIVSAIHYTNSDF